MPEPQQLLKSVVPRADESIQSMAIRLAPFALVSTDELLRLGLKHSSLASLPTNATAIDRLCKLGGFDSVEMKGRSIEPTECGFRVYQRQVPADWVSIDVRRLAPGALASDGDDPFHRLAWQLVPLDCDPSTGQVLVDCCPCCHSRLTWTNLNRVYTCSVCQFDMRESSPKCLSAQRLEAARRLLGFLVGAGPTLPAPFDEADDITSCRAMEWLAYFVELSIGKSSIQPSCRNAAMGIVSLHRWPRSFDDALIEILQNSACPIVPSEKPQRRFADQIIDAVVRAGTPLLHDILLTRATEKLGAKAFGRKFQ